MLNPDRDSPRRSLLTVREVGLMLGCGRTLVYDLIGSRQLPVVKIGRLTRVPVAAVDDFVSRHVTSPDATFGRRPE
jgi:excisionase family DNA binding protein